MHICLMQLVRVHLCTTSKSSKDVLVILAYGETRFHQMVSKQCFLAILPGRRLKLFDLSVSHSISQYFTAPLTKQHTSHMLWYVAGLYFAVCSVTLWQC